MCMAGGGGGEEEVSQETFPISTRFNYKIGPFHQNFKSLCYNIRK